MNEQNRSTFESPAYKVQRIDIDELVSQKANPNQMSGKHWDALQISIKNTGYTFSVIAGLNSDYDPATEGMPKPSLLEHTDNNKDVVTNTEAGMQVADEEIGKYFKYRLIDGAHRSQVVRQGKYWFENGYDHSADWVKGERIPEDPGREMLAYIAWRENFTIPCVLLDLDPTAQMSAEVLHNTARGAHSLDSMKDIVNNLISVAGMSEEWVSKHLFLDLESIKRMQQLSGLKASMSDIDDADMAWNVKSSDSYKRKMDAYLNREAAKYTAIYTSEHPEVEVPTTGSVQEIAIALGWDLEAAKKSKKTPALFAPNGINRDRGPNVGYPK